MRKSFDGLIALTRHVIEQDPLSGYWFVFVNRNRDYLKAPLWLSRSLTYSMLGGEDCYAKYKAFVQNGVDAVTAEFYGGDSLTGIFGEKDFRQMIYDHRDCHEVAHELPSLVNQRPEPEEIVSVVAEVLGSHGRMCWKNGEGDNR